jgi:hypothetical protein
VIRLWRGGVSPQIILTHRSALKDHRWLLIVSQLPPSIEGRFQRKALAVEEPLLKPEAGAEQEIVTGELGFEGS